MKSSLSLKSEFKWWLRNIYNCKVSINTPNYETQIFTDASPSGWGAYCNQKEAKGVWNENESKEHINQLELRAVGYGLKSFAKDLKNCHILLRIDNTTAISYINRMGGIKFTHLNEISREIWRWCKKRNIFLFASYIPTKENIRADKASRDKNTETEYSLHSDAFKQITEILGFPEIDLLASYNNAKCKKFVSWHPDLESIAVYAFTLYWGDFFAYIFPPFTLTSKILKKN